MSQDTLHRCKILEVDSLTHDVKRFVVERPEGYDFEPGQATEVSVAADGWEDEARPFTFTSLPSDERLELTVKLYPDHDGVTERMGDLAAGDALLLRDVWGAIAYRGPGVFLAGGAGVTPFIAILRRLRADGGLSGHTLIFSNKTADDVILKDEFDRMDGLDVVYTLTRQDPPAGSGFLKGRIDRELLEAQGFGFDRPFYVCGPPAMVEGLIETLGALGADADDVVFER